MTRAPSPAIKLAIDFVPLLVFFAVNRFADIYWATGVFMAAIATSMLASRALLGKISPMLWFTGAVVLIFGGATLYLRDDTFIKIKPTILYVLFAAILLFGLATKRPLLKMLLSEAFPALDDHGWRKLTRNWALLFVGLAVANETARQLLTTDQWVDFKVWGVTAITFLFALSQAPLLTRHAVPVEPPADR